MAPNSDGLTSSALNRRGFAQAAVFSALAAAATATAAPAQEPKAEEKITMAKAVEAIVRQRFGEHLTEEQIKKVVLRVQNYLAAKNQRQPALKNSDEPAFVFQPDM
ncbi:MAG TPA: hypothetical protein VGZ47_22355 [Gemmataceae bacterium]|jgi:hypothetical protein|nr:hypothetical protein [Gemmataceae bacterium]